MAAGSVQYVLVCAASADGSTAAPCPSGQAPQALQAYIADPGQASFFDAVAQPYDFTTGGEFWGVAFVFTMTLYIGARIYGAIISMVR